MQSLMPNMQFAIIIAIFASFQCISATDLPSFLHVCQRDDPKLEECMMKSVEDLRPYLVNGVPESYIPSLEPLKLSDFFTQESAGMKIKTYNVSAYGCSDFVVKDLKVLPNTHDVEIAVNIPKLRILSQFYIDGKILVVPVKGNGDFEANITDCKATAKMTGDIYQKNGEDYLRFSTIELTVKIGGGQIRLANMFNGDKVLLGIINEAVNRNFDMFLRDLLPGIQKSLQIKFLEISNAIVEPYTYKQLFPY